MRTLHLMTVISLCILLCLLIGAAKSPFTIERIFTPPWLFGTSMQSVSLSDDGRWLACGWDQSAQSHRDLWLRDNTTGAWYQRTDYWTEREARLRREFARDLRKAKAEWDAAHTKTTDQAGESTEPAGTDKKKDEFDEQKRIDDFEKDLKKRCDEFGGIGQTLFRRGTHELLWIYEGAVYSIDLDDPAAEACLRLRHEQGFSSLSLPPLRQDGSGSDAILLDSDADLFLWYPDGGEGMAPGALRQLTTGGWGERPNNQGYAITPDLHWLAYCTRDFSATRKTQIPELLADDPYTTNSTLVRAGDTPERVSLTLLDLTATPPWPVEVKLCDEPYYQLGQIQWSPEPGVYSLLVAVITGDTHELKVYTITPPGTDESEPVVELVYRERDDKWLNWDLMNAFFDREGRMYVQSECEGRSQLYRLIERPAADTKPSPAEAADTQDTQAGGAAPASDPVGEDWGTHERQLMFAAAGEITSTDILPDGLRAVVEAADPDPSCRNLYMLDLATGTAQPLFPGTGYWRSAVAFSADSTTMAYTYGDERHQNELALMRLPAIGEMPVTTADTPVLQRLSDSAQNASGWQEWADSWDVRFIQVTGEYGPIAVKLHLPPGWKADGSYPLLLWAHGGGYAQTAVRQPGFLELLHPWLAQEHGWICAEVDYSGSSGYGRDWRVNVWGNLGNNEVDDLVSVKNYMVHNYGADTKRTALWGWSYGGFLTLMALGLKPGEFPVGIAVAPVTRWENYHNWFSLCRLGTPADHPDEYEQSNAETYLKDIKDHLLIVHGLRDDNTVFQSVAQYLEKSHELGVNVELKLFPSDSHGIGNDHHYIRVFEALVEYCEAHWEP